jgi:flagella basal body P-ring formation protein FlgA
MTINNLILSILIAASVNLVLGGTPNYLVAEDSFPIRLVGRSTVSVTVATISLGDIADILVSNPIYDKDVLRIKQIELAKSPPPGKNTTISGLDIVDIMRREQVNLSIVGYQIPQTITVKRSGRELTSVEAETAINSFLTDNGRDALLKGIDLPPNRTIFSGPVNIKALLRGESLKGRTTFAISVRMQDSPEELLIPVIARFDEFGDVPVASRNIGRGEVVRMSDFVMARLNLAQLPSSVLDTPQQLVGQEVRQAVKQGEPFAKDYLSIPAVIKKGDRVKLMFKSALLEASATGVALADGRLEDIIDVRNSSSMKIVQGKIVAPGIVRVGP